MKKELDIIEKRTQQILSAGVRGKKFARDLAKAENTLCPRCGRRGKVWSHPACGVMVDCSCGARASMRDWTVGKITLELQPNGTYKSTAI